VFVPGLTVGKSGGFVLLDYAFAEPIRLSWAAATVMAALPRKRRRLLLISSDICFSPLIVERAFAETVGISGIRMLDRTNYPYRKQCSSSKSRKMHYIGLWHSLERIPGFAPCSQSAGNHKRFKSLLAQEMSYAGARCFSAACAV
jgi:hypothetical protein